MPWHGGVMEKILALLLVLLFSSPLSAEMKSFDIPLGGSPVIGHQTAQLAIVEFVDYQ